jgi:glutamine synthetase
MTRETLRQGLMSREQLRAGVVSGQLDTVVLAFADMHGRLCGKRFHAPFFVEEVMANGTSACDYLFTLDPQSEPVAGYALSSWETGHGDMRLVPDFSTLRSIPWQRRTTLVLADAVSLDNEPINVSPRHILKNQLDRLADRGWTAMVGTELEFTVFDGSYEHAWDSGYRELIPANRHIVDYSVLGTSRVESLLQDIRTGMAGAGMPVESAKGEGSPGQHEITLRYADALTTCDQHVVFKTGVKEIAAQHGRALTFMAKVNEQAGNSCHIHLSLRDKADAPVMAGAGRHGLSRTGERFIAGILAGLRELTLFLAPNVNSYKRFVPGLFAPTKVNWGIDNRGCALRLVGSGSALRIECRVPGGDANPYLAVAALLAAGIDGVERELSLGEPRAGDGYAADEPTIPAELRDALTLWQDSKLARSAFSDGVVEHYARMARTECAAYRTAITDWELRRSFECI